MEKAKQIVKMKKAEFMAFVRGLNGAQMAHVISLGESGLLKTGNPYKNALKRSDFIGNVGADYERSVNNQLMREGKEPEFIAEKRLWGERLDRFFVHHKGNFYLTVKVNRDADNKAEYIDETGNVIPFEAVKPFIPVRAPSNTQAEHEIDKEVMPRDVRLDRIESIAIGGKLIKVIV